jgi:hypothetical protein
MPMITGDHAALARVTMSERSSRSSATASGLKAGAALAMVISYATHHHIGWAILHAIFGWFYVAYYYYAGSWQGSH